MELNQYINLISLIKCAGITAILLIIAVIVISLNTPDYPDDDGEHL